MVKKMKSTAQKATGTAQKSAKDFSAKDFAGKAAATLMDSQLANNVKDSAQHIWLAGMGAFSRVQEEGTKAFEALIKEGLSLQKKTQGLAEEKISEVTGKMSAMAGTVSAKAGQNWDKLEGIFEQRTAKAMNKLGVPTAKDVEALTKRVDELAAAVGKLGKSGAAKAVTKTAAKRVAAPAKAPAKRARKSAAA